MKLEEVEVGQVLKPISGKWCARARLDDSARRRVVSVDSQDVHCEVVESGYADSTQMNIPNIELPPLTKTHIQRFNIHRWELAHD